MKYLKFGLVIILSLAAILLSYSSGFTKGRDVGTYEGIELAIKYMQQYYVCKQKGEQSI